MDAIIPGSDLTLRQKRFIWNYLSGPTAMNALRSAIMAGYSEKSAPRASRDILNNPNVAAEITRRLTEIQVKLECREEHVRAVFAHIMLDPRTEAEGGPSRTERMKAAREYGELMGLYVEKSLHADVTLEQLLRLANEREKELPPAEKPARLLRVIDGNAA